MKLILLDGDNKVSQILKLENEDERSYWIAFFNDLTPFEGEIPQDVSYQHRLVDSKLVFDETVVLEISEVEPDPRDAKIAQMEADLDYYEMVVEAQEETLARQQADIDYVLMITEG